MKDTVEQALGQAYGLHEHAGHVVRFLERVMDDLDEDPSDIGQLEPEQLLATVKNAAEAIIALANTLEDHECRAR